MNVTPAKLTKILNTTKDELRPFKLVGNLRIGPPIPDHSTMGVVMAPPLVH